MTIGVLGMGRFGKSLVGGLTALGLPVLGKGRGGLPLHEWAASCTVWCLAVRDDQITAAVASLEGLPADGKTVLIHSGSVALDSLDPLRRAGAKTGKLHPLQSFSGGEAATIPAGTPFAFEGDIEGLVSPWVNGWQGSLHRLSGDQWLVYHLAAVTAANFLPLFIRTGADILAPMSSSREAALDWLAPLVRRSVEAALQAENQLPFAGPAVRGDKKVMAAHEAWLKRRDPELAGLYRAASRRIAYLAKYDPDDEA